MNQLVVIFILLGLLGACSKPQTEEGLSSLAIPYSKNAKTEQEITRIKKFSEVKSSNTKLETKFLAAENYFKSLNFVNSSSDALAEEFIEKLADLYRDIYPEEMNSIRQKENNNAERAYFALAAKMHFGSPSLYEILEKNSYEDIFQSDKHRPMIIELLKARVNILATFAVKHLMNKQNTMLRSRAKASISQVVEHHFDYFELKEEPSLNAIEDYLRMANQTKRLLLRLEENKIVQKDLRAALEAIPVFDRSPKGGATTKMIHANATQTLLSDLVHQLLF